MHTIPISFLNCHTLTVALLMGQSGQSMPEACQAKTTSHLITAGIERHFVPSGALTQAPTPPEVTLGSAAILETQAT